MVKIQVKDWIDKKYLETQLEKAKNIKALQLYKVVVVRSVRHKSGEKLYAIGIKITYNKEESHIALGIRVKNKSLFDRERNIIMGQELDTLLLQEVLKLIDDKFILLLKLGEPFTVKDIKALVTGIEITKEEIPTILGALEIFRQNVEILNENDGCCVGTLRKNKTRYNRISEFCIERYGNKGKLEDITPFCIESFVLWLKNKRNYNQNSSQMLAQHFQRFMNFCVSTRWIPSSPFILYKKKFEPVEVKYLTEEEIAKLWNTTMAVEALERQKDVFLFMLELGMNYADIAAHRKTDFMMSKSQTSYIVKPRTKTGISQVIPISPKAQFIIEKYKNDAQCLQKNQFVPVIDMMPMNRSLKQIALICGITKPLSTKYARKSKITGMFENGANIDEIQMVAGHKVGSDITIKHYVSNNPTVLINRYENLKKNEQK